MKKILTAILFAILLFVSCQEDLSTKMEMGPQKDEAILNATPAITLRSPKSAEGVVNVLVTEGAGFASERIFATASRPVDMTQTIVVKGDTTLVEAYRHKTGVDYLAMPDAFYAFDGSRTLGINQGAQESSPTVLKIYATNPVGNQLAPGRYLLPVVANSSLGDVSTTLYYDIVVRKPFEGDAELYEGEDAFVVFYINTEQYDPRLVTDFYIAKVLRSNTIKQVWYKALGEIINLRKVTISLDEESNRAILSLGNDIRFVLDHAEKYILPLKESGRRVCLCIEGANKGIGFCNMNDAQIVDFATQIKRTISLYGLDGVNLWDRNSGYNQEGALPQNTTSYPQLIKAIREAIGPDKIISITDYEDPTSYFGDLEATAGIEVGKYIDYAWSGYNRYEEGYQVIDPYHQDSEFASKLHPRHPIAGLDASKYGCINAPWGTAALPTTISDETYDNLYNWISSGLNANKICVYEDLRTNLQDKLEGNWDPCELITAYNSPDMTYLYQTDISRLWHTGEEDGYGKWIKDW